MVRGFLILLLAAAGLSACETPDETLKATAYGEIVRAQMTAGNPAGARRTVELALKTIDEDDKDYSSEFTIAAAAVAQTRAGDLAGAEETMRRASKSAANVILALALAEAGHIEAARRIAGDITNVGQPDKEVAQDMALVAWVMARSGDIAGARQIEERITDANIRDEATALIAWAQAGAGDATGALATLEGIGSPGSDNGDMALNVILARGIAIDVYETFDELFMYADRPLQIFVWNATALTFAETGDMDGARQAFDETIKTANAINNMDNRLQALAVTGLAQAVAGDRKSAIATLDYVDSLLLQAKSEANTDINPGKTIRLIDAVRTAIDGQPDITELTGYSDVNDVAEFLIKTAIFQIRLRNLDGAASSVDWLVERQSDLRDISLLVAGLGRLAVARLEAGDATAARERAAQALELAQGIPKTDEVRIIAMFFASVALARVGNIEDALTAAAEIREREQPAQ